MDHNIRLPLVILKAQTEKKKKNPPSKRHTDNSPTVSFCRNEPLFGFIAQIKRSFSSSFHIVFAL